MTNFDWLGYLILLWKDELSGNVHQKPCITSHQLILLWLKKEEQKLTNVGKTVEKLESSYANDRSVNYGRLAFSQMLNQNHYTSQEFRF